MSDPPVAPTAGPAAAPAIALHRGVRRRTFLVLLAAITLLGAGLRVYELAGPSFWVDELFTVRSTALLHDGVVNARSLAYVPSTIGLRLAGIDPDDLAAEGYHTWQAAGVSEWVVRLPYCLIGIATLPIVGLLSVRLIGPRPALILTLLLAISPWHVWMSQLGRFYTQQFLIYNLAFVLFFLWTQEGERPRGRQLVLLGALLVAGFWTQTGSLVILLVLGLDMLVGRLRGEPVRIGAAGWLGLGVALACCTLIWLGHYVTEPEAYTAFVGSKQSATDLLLGTPYMVGVSMTVLAGLAGLWLLPAQPRLALYLGLGALAPLALFMAMAAAGVDMHLRYTFVGLYAWLALAAVGLEALWQALRPRLGAALAAAPLGVVVVASLFHVYAYFSGGAGFRPAWREAFAHVAQRQLPGEPVVSDYIPSIVGSYYLQQPVVRVAANMTAADLDKLGPSCWVVVRGYSPTGGERFAWLTHSRPLEAYFNNRVLQPYHAVHVYRYLAAPDADVAAVGR